MAWALTSVAMRPVIARALWSSSLLRLLVCTVLLAAYAIPTGVLERAAAAPPEAWLWLLGSTLSSIVVGDSLYFMSASRIGVARALPIASSFPLLTTIGAVVLLDEEPTLALLAGSVLVVVAVALIGGERVAESGRIEVIGVVLAGLAACLWASSGLFLGRALSFVDPITGNMIRFPMAALIFTGYLLVVRPSERMSSGLLWLTIAAGVGTLASALMFLGGIVYAGVARGVALNATSPVFTAILAAALLRERITRRTALGIASSVIGTILLVL